MRKNILFALSFLLFFSCKQKIESVNIGNSVKTQKKWTVIIYMAADNELETYALQDINEMESSFDNNDNISVIFLLDRIDGYDGTNDDWTGTRCFELKKDLKGKNSTIVSKRIYPSSLDMHSGNEVELDTGNSYVLENFVNYAEEFYPAEKYALIMWGHGSGWRGCSFDDTSKSNLTLQGFSKALKDKKIDLLIMDTSFGLNMETLFQLKENFLFFTGTPGINPYTGLDYSMLFQLFLKSNLEINDFINSAIVSSNNRFYAFEGSEIIGLFEIFEECMSNLAKKIVNVETRNNLKNKLFYNVKSFQSSSYPCDLYIDLKSLSENLFENDEEKASGLKLKEILKDREMSIHLIPLKAYGVTESTHSEFYIKTENTNSNSFEKCRFVNESKYWVPGNKGNSMLDKLFYEVY